MSQREEQAVTIDGVTITQEQYENAVKAGIENWERRARGEEHNVSCALCHIFIGKGDSVHKACPLYDEAWLKNNIPAACCSEYSIWQKDRTPQNARHVLYRICAIPSWHTWASKYVEKPKPEPTGPEWKPKPFVGHRTEHNIFLADCEKEIRGMKVRAEKMEDGNVILWIDNDGGRIFCGKGALVMHELLVSKGVPILPYGAWQQL